MGSIILLNIFFKCYNFFAVFCFFEFIINMISYRSDRVLVTDRVLVPLPYFDFFCEYFKNPNFWKNCSHLTSNQFYPYVKDTQNPLNFQLIFNIQFFKVKKKICLVDNGINFVTHRNKSILTSWWAEESNRVVCKYK